MGKKLYVGNLGYDVSASDLEELFAAHGAVESAENLSTERAGKEGQREVSPLPTAPWKLLTRFPHFHSSDDDDSL